MTKNQEKYQVEETIKQKTGNYIRSPISEFYFYIRSVLQAVFFYMLICCKFENVTRQSARHMQFSQTYSLQTSINSACDTGIV